ncbi:expressed unknown protein [Seminavis robusta]|uniref:Uncharacterized protein n=1 Tax=Seminavis robusta TaxID=568900 RepID=A0A9N8EVL1_9STRA|nr:expressed unknown protein [Seminavis robusta]|eukprot:Sro1952_g307500.1 n/a (355) ;mRNA; f:18276-19340
MSGFGGAGDESSSSSTSDYQSDAYSETFTESTFDIVLGCAFLVTAYVAFRRMSISQSASAAGGGGGAETTVVTAFYSLIFVTSILRAIWFLIPSKVWQPSYAPIAVYAWDSDHPAWLGAALSELTVTAGSLTLFSIFILILVYWADILKKYFHPGARRMLPMFAFFALVSSLVGLEVFNVVLFLLKFYTTEGMILFNACLLALVSMICVCEITIFSHRFRTVLKTLGAINQVSTDAQVKRIVWITVTGNLFFFTRAFLEALFALTLCIYWRQHHSVAKVFSHAWWDSYVLVKYTSEVTILALMLYILQTRFTTQAVAAAQQQASAPTSEAGYTKVPDAEPGSSQQPSTGFSAVV